MLRKNSYLQELIRRIGKTQGEIAQEMGISESRLSRIINGYTVPRASEQEILSKILGVDKNQLFQNDQSYEENI